MLLALLLVLGAGCAPGGQDSDGPSGSAGSADPLTGRPVGGPQPDHPVLAVKIDNTASAAPQRGLAAAGLVVEELVEGGRTRLTSFYYSQLPPVVGPVRSMRTTDVGVLAPLEATLASSGGAQPARAALRQADITTTSSGPGFTTSDSRPSPYDMLLRPRKLAPTLNAQPPPQPLLPRAGHGASQLDGRPTRSLRVQFSDTHTTRWRFHAGRGWTRVDPPTTREQAFSADSVLVLQTRTRPAGYRDPAGNPVPETVLTGKGRGWVLTGPSITPIRWAKPDPQAPFQLTTPQGDDLALPPGQTWIELLPTSGSIQTPSNQQ